MLLLIKVYNTPPGHLTPTCYCERTDRNIENRGLLLAER